MKREDHMIEMAERKVEGIVMNVREMKIRSIRRKGVDM